MTPFNGETYDHLIGTKVGGSLFDSNDRRHTAADLLTYANPDNLDVYIWASAQRLVFATGVGKSKCVSRPASSAIPLLLRWLIDFSVTDRTERR